MSEGVYWALKWKSDGEWLGGNDKDWTIDRSIRRHFSSRNAALTKASEWTNHTRDWQDFITIVRVTVRQKVPNE